MERIDVGGCDERQGGERRASFVRTLGEQVAAGVGCECSAVLVGLDLRPQPQMRAHPALKICVEVCFSFL